MADIKLKGYSGTEKEYAGVPKVLLHAPESTDEAPVLVPFTYGEAVSKEVEPDFSGGDMAVPIAEGELVTELTIAKPENLLAENIAEGVDIAGIVGTLAAGKGGSGSTLVYSAVKTLERVANDTFWSSCFEIVSASELAECGIDLTQHDKWYKSGDLYIPVITLTKLKDTDTQYTTTYRCITGAQISNIVRKLSSGSLYHIGYWTCDTENGVSVSVNLNNASVPNTTSTPLSRPYSYFSTNQCLYVSGGSVYAALFFNQNVRYSLNGDYLITVMLIPTT